jgi:hypothetical protein
MSLTLIQGDPLTTTADWLAIGHNAQGRSLTGEFEIVAAQAYPAAFAMYQRRARAGKQPLGTFWQWQASQPSLVFLTLQGTPSSPVRLRHAQQIFLTLARDHMLYNMQSLAIAPLGNAYESADILHMAQMWLEPSSLDVLFYTDYVPDKA